MGLRHVLEHYLRGLRVGPASLRGLPDLDGDLRDMQFESAWRMTEWDPALSVCALRLSATGIGFTGHVWYCLRFGVSAFFCCCFANCTR